MGVRAHIVLAVKGLPIICQCEHDLHAILGSLVQYKVQPPERCFIVQSCTMPFISHPMLLLKQARPVSEVAVRASCLGVYSTRFTATDFPSSHCSLPATRDDCKTGRAQ